MVLVEACKKRWKYLRERYVQQKKQGDTGQMYEHLSRPYLEKMKFLDRYIQPRKSYRGIMSTHMTQSKLEMPDSSKSNCSSTYNMPVVCRLNDISNLHKFEQTIKTEDDMSPSDLLQQQLTESNMEQMQQQYQHHQNNSSASPEHDGNESASPSGTSLMSPPPNVKISISQGVLNNHNNHSNSSSNSDDDTENPTNSMTKHDRNNPMAMSSPFFTNGGGNNHHGNSGGGGGGTNYQHLPFGYNQFSNQYQNMPEQKPLSRSSEELLGELVTSELMKMSGDRKKYVQKKILQLLFFDD